MDVSARVTSKGQVTIPKAVRDALALETGDRVVFRVEQHRAIIARTPDLPPTCSRWPVRWRCRLPSGARAGTRCARQPGTSKRDGL
ncbi:MAG: AbrB/MazE/SpoVT family DNA-binding domain-containing protein, partial [Acidimicrobiaceae bacterium]|nr:AbrB/MazE/SpoVT family DNA-binding domain-containing protein [Acidimicrobiaceae bacterium]